MRLRLILVGLLALLGLVVVVPARAQISNEAPSGSIGIRLLDAPTNRADDPRARLYIVDHLAPGTTISRRVEVSNGTTDTLTLPVYAASATVKNGTFRFGEGHAVNELTTWTSVEPSAVSVAPKGTAIATVKIVVPSDASPGERYGVVWAETPTASPDGGGISAVNRVGIRIYLSVGPGGEPASDFRITALEPRRASDGAPVVAAIVRNTGGRALDLSGELRLTDGPAGLSAGPFEANLGNTLAVGETEPILVKLDKQLPAGPWKAKITLKSGLIERSASATLTFPKEGAGDAVSTGSSKSPVLLGVVIFGGLVLIGGMWFVFGAKRRRSHEDEPAEA